MNVLFLTLVSFDTLQERNIYTDLLREFVKNNYQVYVVSPREKRKGVKSYLIKEKNATILRLKIGNIQKTNVFSKGLSTIMLESTFQKAVKTYFSGVKFDLVLYSTPPITLVSAIEYVKKKDGAMTYLLLKDIFPQNAVDIGMLKKHGVKSLLYYHFRKQEKKLYRISDRIGCMSHANVDYIIKHNPEINPDVVEICPNSIDIVDKSVNKEVRKQIRIQYGIPEDKTVFVYGGNLGKPQGVPFLIECLQKCHSLTDSFFLIIGDGTEYHLISEYLKRDAPKNVKLLKKLAKAEYDAMVGACDVGLIFLDHRFTIPNFPSRLLAYMQAKLPVLAVTDVSTDIGKVIVEGGFGWWCESDNSDEFKLIVSKLSKSDRYKEGQNAWSVLKEKYSVKQSFETITKRSSF